MWVGLDASVIFIEKKDAYKVVFLYLKVKIKLIKNLIFYEYHQTFVFSV